VADLRRLLPAEPDPLRPRRLQFLAGLIAERFLGGPGLLERLRETGLPASSRVVPDLGRWIDVLEGWPWPDGPQTSRALTPELLDSLHLLHPGHKERGSYFTAEDVTGYLARGTLLPWLFSPWTLGEGLAVETCLTRNLDLPALAGEWIRTADEERLLQCWSRLRRVRVLDPTCGAGAFLLAALKTLEPLWNAVLDRLLHLGAPEAAVGLALLKPPARRRAVRREIIENNLFGTDLDPLALELCRRRLQLEWAIGGSLPTLRELPRPQLLLANAVTGPGIEGWWDGVLGNPPGVAARSVDYRAPDLATTCCPNVYAWVAERGLRKLASDGRLGMVLPVSAVSGPEYGPLADLYLRQDCWISTYSNRPAKLFPDVEQRLAILITGPPRGPRPVLRMSPYQHWYEDERPRLFRRLVYAEAEVRDGLPVKTGTPAAAGAFRKIAAAGAPLAQWEGSGPAGVWLHNGPTYWVRALPFRPNSRSGGGGSDHYRFIPTADEESAHALAAILSSSTFYFWFKAVSNCRDLGRKEWEGFPLGWLKPKRRAELAALGQELAERLRATAARRSRKYPSGTVVYEEYYPARAWAIIDRVDRILARQYGLTEEERVYIRDLDLSYRMGRERDGRE
jgi:hypothetical protein